MWRASKWRQASSNGSLYRVSGGYPLQGGEISVHGDLRYVVHNDALPPMPQNLITGWEDVVHDQEINEGGILDRL